MPEQTTSAPTQLESISPAQAAQEYGRHSDEHTAAQIGHLADKLIERSDAAIKAVPTKVSTQELAAGIVVSRRGDLTIKDQHFGTASAPEVNTTVEADVDPEASISRTVGEDSESGDHKVLYTLKSNNSNKGISASVTTRSDTNEPKGRIDVRGAASPIRSAKLRRTVAGRSLGVVRAKVARQEIVDHDDQVEQIDSLFSK